MAMEEQSRSLSLIGERSQRKFQREMLYVRSIFSAEQMAKFALKEADLIGAGNEYRVYLCKSLDCVFKVPRERKVKAAVTVGQVKRDLGMAHAYFTFEQLVQTDILSNQHVQFIVKQKALPNPHGITQEDMQDGLVASQV